MFICRPLGFVVPSVGPIARAPYPRCMSAHMTTSPVSLRMTSQGKDDSISGLELNEERLSLAREAAKKDDLEWFMEFIGEDGGNSPEPSGEASASKLPRYTSREEGAWASQYPSSTRSGRDTNFQREIGQLKLQSDGRREDRRSRDQDLGGGVGGGRGRKPTRTEADYAYDYDFDEEFIEERGEGGWGYDTDLVTDVAARRRDVEASRVRTSVRDAARLRRPIQDDIEDNEEEGNGREYDALWNEGDVDNGAFRDNEKIGSSSVRDEENCEAYTRSLEKMRVLTEELGYTTDEAQNICTDMIDLLVERRVKRPTKGVPTDWVDPATGADATADEDDLYLKKLRGIGSNSEGRQAGTPGSPSSESPGGRSTRRGPRGYSSTPGEETEFYSDEFDGYGSSNLRSRASPSYSYGNDYGAYDGKSANRDRGGGWGSESNGDRTRGPRRRGEGGQQPQQGSDRRQRRKKKMNPAEKYELKLRDLYEDDRSDKTWTGVGPDGPWPSYDEFKSMLIEETEWRVGVVGPWAADIIAAENAFRLEAYSKWLDVLEKGVGRSLEESGVFDFGDDNFDSDGYDEDSYYGDDFNKGRGGGNRVGGEDAQGRRTGGRGSRDRGQDYDGRYGDPQRQAGQRRGQGGGRRRQESGFDFESFLSGGTRKLQGLFEGQDEEAER
ncbi:unnamed protein product [Choristocarpus tenellus]